MKKLLILVILCYSFNLVGCVEVGKVREQPAMQKGKVKKSENTVELSTYQGSWVDIRQKDEPDKGFMGLMITDLRGNMASIQLDYPSNGGALHQIKVGTVSFINNIGKFRFDDDFGNQGTVEIHMQDSGIMLIVSQEKNGGKDDGLQNAKYALTLATDDATLKQ
jgi:major membrane immunogen (membrane-anchored lipoprotein)